MNLVDDCGFSHLLASNSIQGTQISQSCALLGPSSNNMHSNVLRLEFIYNKVKHVTVEPDFFSSCLVEGGEYGPGISEWRVFVLSPRFLLNAARR